MTVKKKPAAREKTGTPVKPEARQVSIILVDDHPIVRQGIRQIIESEKGFTVCAEASSASEAMKLVSEHMPDLAIIDITLTGSISGIDLVKSLKDRYPQIQSLVLSMHDESIFAERAIRSGARGYLMKEVAPKNIIDAIRKIMDGSLYLSEETSGRIIDKLVHGTNEGGATSVDCLSDREFEIFQLIGRGFSTKEIASKLNLSIFTIESHKRNIKEKMKLKDSAEVLKHAIQWVLMQKQ
jgi:DNA-binding NarL/FixJ family response regulator